MVWELGRAVFLACGLAVSPRGSSNPNRLSRRPQLLIPSPWGVGVQHMNLGGRAQTCIHSRHRERNSGVASQLDEHVNSQPESSLPEDEQHIPKSPVDDVARYKSLVLRPRVLRSCVVTAQGVCTHPSGPGPPPSAHITDQQTICSLR